MGISRKIQSFLIMVAAIQLTIALTTVMHTPEAIANTALYIIGFGGLFTIGGQALVDAVTKSKWGGKE